MRIDRQNNFEGEIADIPLVNFEDLKSDLEKESQFDYYSEVLGAHLKFARDKGDSKTEKVFGFIQTLLGPLPNFHCLSEPFRPYASGRDSRTFLADDLTDYDLKALGALAECVDECVLLS